MTAVDPVQLIGQSRQAVKKRGLVNKLCVGRLRISINDHKIIVNDESEENMLSTQSCDATEYQQSNTFWQPVSNLPELHHGL